MALRPIRLICLTSAAVAALAATSALAEVPLASYRAVHDLALDTADGLPDVGEVSGRLVTEFTGSACAGYTTKSRFVTRSTSDEGERQTNDLRSTTYETGDGTYEFSNETYADEELIELSEGAAKRGTDGVAVTLTKPDDKTFALDGGVVFPTEQVSRVIGAAIAGERFLAFDVYDGSETGERVFGTATVIGRASTAADDLGAETGIAEAGFAGLRHWPVTISYFEQPSRSEMTPVYTMSLVLYENGVPRDIKLDYGTFALVGTLTHLEMLPSPPCPG